MDCIQYVMLHFGSCSVSFMGKEAVEFQGISERGGVNIFLSLFFFSFKIYTKIIP